MTTAAIGVRRAEAKDAQGIAKVHEESWKHAYSGLIPYNALDAMIARRDFSWWTRAIKNSTRILVLEDGEFIVGYATLGANRVSALEQDGEIYEIYLLPEYQGVGLGKNLFLAARQEIANSGLKGCLVWVLQDNIPAIKFYQNAGGRDTAEGTETFDGRKLKKTAFAFD